MLESVEHTDQLGRKFKIITTSTVVPASTGFTEDEVNHGFLEAIQHGQKEAWKKDPYVPEDKTGWSKGRYS
jgi:hypothetical protein